MTEQVPNTSKSPAQTPHTPKDNVLEEKIRAEAMTQLDAAWDTYQKIAIIACEGSFVEAKSSDER